MVFLGNILTVIINTFKTTYKRLARLIGETFNGVVKSVKLLLTAENDETKYKEAVKVLLYCNWSFRWNYDRKFNYLLKNYTFSILQS